MFIIDKVNNKLDRIEKKTFHDLGFREREHLQEWIAKDPSCLGGEELLIIQKEFDGFNDTNERLDLLALDKEGALVIIENKLDDTGKDVSWQALKYVSYCSTLSAPQIVDIYQQYLDKQGKGEKAKEKLVEFYDDKSFDELSLNERDQRMVLVAGYFRKEVTSTAMWMINHGISVQCFKATPYKNGDELLLDIEQIIPVKEAEDYLIKMADKAKEVESAKELSKGIMPLRKKYWRELLDKINMESQQFQNVNPTTDNWLSSGSGVSGIAFVFRITQTNVSVELSIEKNDANSNKSIFDKLYDKKEEIERAYGEALNWNRFDNIKKSVISSKLENVNITDTKCWDKMKKFQSDSMQKLYSVFHERLKKVAR